MNMTAGTKIQLKLTVLIFLTKFTQEEYFWFRKNIGNIVIEFYIFELDKVPKYQLKQRILNFLTKLA